MNYGLAKQLKEAGFKQEGKGEYINRFEELVIERPDLKPLDDLPGYLPYIPTLSELIEACGFGFERLEQRKDGRTPEGYRLFSGWYAIAWDADDTWSGEGATPEEAVANLWLKVKEKN